MPVRNHYFIKKIISLSVCLQLSFLCAFAGILKGKITDENGKPLPYANIYVKNTTYGACTNGKGEYFLELKSGKYTISYSFIGYDTFEKEVTISNQRPCVVNVILKESPHVIKEVSVSAKRKDLSKEIMQKVRDRRKYYLNQIQSYQCKTYAKTSLEKELVRIKQSDTISLPDTTKKEQVKDMKDHLKKEKLNFIESVSETYFKSPSSYKEMILAHHDYVEKKVNIGRSASLTIEYGEDDVVPEPVEEKNPYIIYEDISSCDFNFYRNLISYPAISEKPLLSPIAANSGLSYTFRFIESFFDGNRMIYKIEVEPVFKNEALFSGTLFIEDSTWALTTVNLSINSSALYYCNEFRIIQDYEEKAHETYLPVRRELMYSIRDGKYNILGNTRVSHSGYEINKEIPGRVFNNEIKHYEVDAFDKDSAYWATERPITLKESELEFIRKSDSISEYLVSDEYYYKIDSVFNRIHWWIWLTGYGHRYRKKGLEFFAEGLLSQINPFGIGGYRHKLPGYIKKEFKNNYLLETRGFVDYGFRNRDVKGKLGVGFTYIPIRFVRTFIEAGDFYDQINNHASIEQTFSRSNYVRTKSYSIAQRMEIVNGLFGELTFLYSDQDPIDDLQLSNWSEWLFGELNEPVEFIRYIKSELKLHLKYRINQKYIIKNNKKIIIGTDYPEITFIYRKGIPELFDSEVNYDYIEAGASNEITLARLGSSRWHVFAGSFLNKSNLRLLEYKYFRGSDRFFFSDPLRSFQLLGPTMNTPNEYFSAAYIHHFEGTILNKIPVLNRLRLSLAGGAGTLVIPDSDFSHFEMFAGLERSVRIKKQLFRFGIYAVTADNSLEDADITLKFGIDFYDSIANKWSY